MATSSTLASLPDHSPFRRVRDGFKTVAARAGYVTIRTDRIPAYAASLQKKSEEEILDKDRHYSGDPEAAAAYLLTLDAINFGSGYKPFLAREGLRLEQGSIYFTFSTRLKRYVEKSGAPTAVALAGATRQIISQLLGLGSGQYSNEFAAACARSWNDLGRAVAAQAHGSFLAYIEQTRPSAAAMVERLIQMDMFNDVQNYKGLQIPFYKRAQHNVVCLDIEFRRMGRPLFDDIGDVTMFADNAVPKVLYVDGILEYDPGLARRIATEELIPAGSEEEIEIRACAGHAVELIAAAANMKSTDVDFILWHKSVEIPAYKQTPSHRTLSVFY